MTQPYLDAVEPVADDARGVVLAEPADDLAVAATVVVRRPLLPLLGDDDAGAQEAAAGGADLHPVDGEKVVRWLHVKEVKKVKKLQYSERSPRPLNDQVSSEATRESHKHRGHITYIL